MTQEDLEKAERRLAQIIGWGKNSELNPAQAAEVDFREPGFFSAEEYAVMSRYILTDSLPEWLYAHNLDARDPRSLKEFQAMRSALEKLAVWYGLE